MKSREETVEEKIDRLGQEVQDLQEQVGRLLSRFPPITTASCAGTAT